MHPNEGFVRDVNNLSFPAVARHQTRHQHTQRHDASATPSMRGITRTTGRERCRLERRREAEGGPHHTRGRIRQPQPSPRPNTARGRRGAARWLRTTTTGYPSDQVVRRAVEASTKRHVAELGSDLLQLRPALHLRALDAHTAVPRRDEQRQLVVKHTHIHLRHLRPQRCDLVRGQGLAVVTHHDARCACTEQVAALAIPHEACDAMVLHSTA